MNYLLEIIKIQVFVYVVKTKPENGHEFAVNIINAVLIINSKLVLVKLSQYMQKTQKTSFSYCIQDDFVWIGLQSRVDSMNSIIDNFDDNLPPIIAKNCSQFQI